MKIRIGNDFKTKWAITFLGEPEDFSDATDIALFFNIYDKKIELTKDVNYTITDNIIEIDVTPDICNILGVYNLELRYTKPNEDFIDGERRSAVDIDAFRIVGKSEKADATQDVSVISDAVAIFLDIAYKKLEEIEGNEDVRIASENERKDAEDIRVVNENIRISNEQDRQINTTTAIGNAEQATLNANNSAVYANEQGAYAEEMSSHPPTIINDYWHIWDLTTNQYESTGQYARGDSAIDGALVVQEKGQSAVNTMSQKAITDDLELKANHGYTSNPKTLKQVDDEIVQLESELSGYAKKDETDIVLNNLSIVSVKPEDFNIQGWIKSDGSYANQTGWLATDFIEIKGGLWLNVNKVNTGASTPHQCVYNSNMELIKAYICMGYTSVRLPDNAKYIRLCWLVADLSNAKANVGFDANIINDIDIYLNNIDLKFNTKISTENIDVNWRIDTALSDVNNAAFHHSSAYDSLELVPVTEGETIFARYSSSASRGVAGFDENGVFIKWIKIGSATNGVEVVIPNLVKYISIANIKTFTNFELKRLFSSDFIHKRIDNDFKEVDIEYTDGVRLNSSGNADDPSSLYTTSNFIQVFKGDVINVKTNAGANLGFIIQYDENKKFAEVITRQVCEQRYKIRQDGYVRYSTFKDEPHFFKKTFNIEKYESIINTLNERISELESAQSENVNNAILFDMFEKQKKSTSTEIANVMRSMGVEPKWYGYQYVEVYTGTEHDIRIASSEEAMSLHSSLPIQSKIRRCITDRVTGIVKYYLDKDNSLLKENGANAILDGSDGNFMVEIPDFYYKCETEMIQIDDTQYKLVKIKLSEFCIDETWVYSRKCYTSAVEAIADRELNQLCSVITTNFNFNTENINIKENNKHIAVDDGYSLGIQKTAIISSFSNNATRYRGGVNNYEYDSSTLGSNDFERNQLGRPIASINRGELNKMLPNRNFTIHRYDTLISLTVLYIVEYATTNAQLPFQSNNEHGYKQGGTGMGATVYPHYNAFEYFWQPQGGGAVLPQGTTICLGNNTGQVFYKMTNVPIGYTGSASIVGEITERGDVWMPIVSYRGVENFYGHLYKIVDGINIQVFLNENDVKQAKLFYQHNPYRYSDNSIDGYEYLGDNSTTGNYVEEMVFSNNNRYSALSQRAKATLGSGTKYGGDFAENLFHNATISPKLYYTTFNGRIVSGSIVGLFFSCSLYEVEGSRRRPSDTTRLDHY